MTKLVAVAFFVAGMVAGELAILYYQSASHRALGYDLSTCQGVER